MTRMGAEEKGCSLEWLLPPSGSSDLGLGREGSSLDALLGKR